MPVYQGGKSRLGKRIYNVICALEEDLSDDEYYLAYFEPMVGMAGVMKHFGDEDERDLYACDINKDIVLMWKAFQKGWKPPNSCSRKKFENLKSSTKHSAERGFLGCVASWGGTFLHDYRLDRGSNDYLGEGIRSLNSMKECMANVKFYNAQSYHKFQPYDMLVYLDPPYERNNLHNRFFQEFDHKKFWDIAREWSKNNIVVVSENGAPKDFKKIWQATSTIASGQTTGAKKYADCLYIHQNLYKAMSDATKRKIKRM